MRKLLTLVALFVVSINTYAQTIGFINQPCPPEPENNDDWVYTQRAVTLPLNGENVQFFFGNFDEVPGYPGTSDIYFEDMAGTIHAIPTKSFSKVFDLKADQVGNILIATNNGLYVFRTSLDILYGQNDSVTLVHPLADGSILYCTEIPHEFNPEEKSCTTALYYASAGMTEKLLEVQARVKGFEVLDTIGHLVLGPDPGKDATGVTQYFYGFNMNTLEVIPGFEPTLDNSVYSQIGYGGVMKKGNTLYFAVPEVGSPYSHLLTWDGVDWNHVGTPLYGGMYVVDGQLYNGAYRLDTETFEQEAAAVAGNQMANARINSFNGSIYVYNYLLSKICIGAIANNPDDFETEEYLNSSIAKIGYVTDITDQQPNSINIYPNPASNEVVIDGMIDIAIYSLLGEKLNIEWLDNSTINTSSYVSGMYYIFGKNEQGQLLSAQLVVQH